MPGPLGIRFPALYPAEGHDQLSDVSKSVTHLEAIAI